MTRGERRHRITLLSVLLLSMGTFTAPARAQAGELLCSGGSNDGGPCQAHTDCRGGACVVVQGVCNDQNGFPCDCPGATCSGSTCTGGPFVGQTCDSTYNCDGSVACQGSQKVCVGGSASGTLLPPGYPCLNDQQCDSAQCRSTGRVCNQNTAFARYSCGQDSDCCTPDTTCPVGGCFSPASVPTPTATASRSGVAVTPTPPPSARATATVTPQLTPPPHRTRPPAHGTLYESIGEGGGCTTAGDRGWSLPALAALVVLWVARRRSGARQPLG